MDSLNPSTLLLLTTRSERRLPGGIVLLLEIVASILSLPWLRRRRE